MPYITEVPGTKTMAAKYFANGKQERKAENLTGIKLMTSGSRHMMEVYGEKDEKLSLDVSDYEAKISADGTAELRITIKGRFNESETAANLIEV